jgi:transformation/transcription domain-associated protein
MWLLTQDDSQGSLAKAFEVYKGDLPTWYFITFIPQMLISLSRNEARISKSILIRIAKAYPQVRF